MSQPIKPRPFSRQLSEFDPVVPLRPGNCSKTILVCIPGAGASVTSFIHLLDELSAEYTVYGLQPRGLYPEQTPDTSVETAAQFNIHALTTVAKDRRIHLIGHSFGGVIAFEMARQCLGGKLDIASLTVVDSSAPVATQVTPPDITDAQARSAFIAALEENLEVRLNVHLKHVEHDTPSAFVHALHTAMIKAGQMPAQSHPDALSGSFKTFAAAIRADYVVSSRYAGKIYLITAEASSERSVAHKECVTGWQRVVEEVDAWQGSGNHFSILRQPHVHTLAQHWTSCIKE